ncbi:4Fe-4S binding protein [Desulfobacula sp.]|nr:4Fe-4S binding protein [Desulfobacula sp.]
MKQPYVVVALCIGCGICEHICPVQGTVAIRVVGKHLAGGAGSGYG